MAAESGEELQMEVHFPSGSVGQFGSSIIVLFIFEISWFFEAKTDLPFIHSDRNFQNLWVNFLNCLTVIILTGNSEKDGVFFSETDYVR